MSNLLRIRELLSNPASLKTDEEWLTLGGGDQSAILVYGAKLSNAILKNSAIAPAQLIQYYLEILRLPQGSLPNIESLFTKTPLLLSGQSHLDARKIFAKKYQEIDKDLDQWLTPYTTSYVSQQNLLKNFDPVIVAENYLDGIFRTIIARQLGVYETEIPSLPDKLFTLYPEKNRLLQIERTLEELKQFILSKLNPQNLSLETTQILLSTYVVGIEPLVSAITYGILFPPPNNQSWIAEELFRESSAVNFFSRVATEDIDFGTLHLSKGQIIYVCPQLIHQYLDLKDEGSKPSYAFGSGLHLCLGRLISIKIANCLFSYLPALKLKVIQEKYMPKLARDNINLKITLGDS